jgi:hypothetical protein
VRQPLCKCILLMHAASSNRSVVSHASVLPLFRVSPDTTSPVRHSARIENEGKGPS